MAKDLLLSIGIGASMQAGAGAVFGSTRKYLAGLGKAIEANARSVSRIKAYRALEARLGKTRAAAREAAERVVKLGAAMRKAEKPSKAMQKELGKARREAQRFTARVAEQARALDKHRAKLRAAGEDVRDLARRERELGAVLEKQRRQRDRLTDSLARQQAATERRSAMRGRLVDAVALGYPLVRTLKDTIGEAVRFESVIADVRKVMDFETPGQFEAMGRDLRILSTRLPAAPDAAAAKRQIAERLSQPGFEPIGITRADGKQDIVFSRVETPAGLEDVYVTESFIDHIVDGKKDHRERFADWILPSLQDPAEVWLTEVTDGRGRKVYRRRFITAFQGPAKDKPTIAVTQEGKDGSLAWTFHRRDARSMDSQRSGFLLYRRPRREEGG